MRLRTVHDDIDPDVVLEEDGFEEGSEGEARQYVIGEDGHRVINLELSAALAKKQLEARPKSWVKPLAAVLMLAFVGLTAWNIVRLTHPESEIPKPTPYQLKQALYLGVMRIEAYRKTHDGAAPDTPGQAGLPDDAGYVYKRTGSTSYHVEFVHGNDPTFQYDSTTPVDAYFGSPKSMLAMGEAK